MPLFPTICPYWLTHIIDAIKSDFSDSNQIYFLELKTQDIIDQLKSGEIDFGIIAYFDELIDDDLEYQYCYDEEFLLALDKGFCKNHIETMYSGDFLDSDGKLGISRLKGIIGDKINAVLTACGHNLRMIMKYLRKLLKNPYFLPFLLIILSFYWKIMAILTQINSENQRNLAI